jgi:hypothetical protein
MDSNTVLDHNRVILCHFDSYSAASVFARYGKTILMPNPLPEGTGEAEAPAEIGEHHSPDAVIAAVVEKYGLNPAEMGYSEGFQAWVSSEAGPIRIHLIRFTTFEAPKAAIEPHGGVFTPISQMRGMPMEELNLVRKAFDLMMNGG